jgi:hypothetical protein
MKKIILLFVGVLVSSLTFARTGEEDSKNASEFALVKKTGSLYKLIYKSSTPMDVTVTILNAESKIVYKEIVRKSSGFIRPYNLESMPAGPYTFKVEKGDLTERQTVYVNSVDTESETLQLTSLVKIQEGKYMLASAGKDQEQLSIQIFNEEGDMIYNASKLIDGAFAQLYTLKDLSGTFSFKIADNHGQVKTFIK